MELTRQTIRELKLPNIDIIQEAIRDLKPLNMLDEIVVKTAYGPVIIGYMDNVTLKYNYNFRLETEKNLVSYDKKIIVYKYLDKNKISSLLTSCANDCMKCLKELNIIKKKKELEKDF